MSPDIEWHVGDEQERETIVCTPPPLVPRWRRVLITLSILLGAGLGVLYTAVPERPPLPSPTPTVVSLPPPLEPVVAAEARALADGDRAAFMALQDQVDGEWYRAQAANFAAWGRPAHGDRLYALVSYVVQADGRAWAEVNQWVTDEVYVYQRRFYRLRDGEWKRARPDPAYWSGERWNGRTTSFEIDYPVEDNRPAWRVTRRLERVYDVLCRDLNCNPRGRRVFSFTAMFRAGAGPLTYDATHQIMSLPSPSLIGLYEPFGLRADAYTTFAYDVLLEPVARLATGDHGRWARNRNGELFLQGIMAWERLRINQLRDVPPERIFIEQPGGLSAQPSQGNWTETRQFYRDLLADQKLIPPADLWAWPPSGGASNDLNDLAEGEVDALIAFVEERYSARSVIRLLNALGPARSLPEAIEAGLGEDYEALIGEWRSWIGR
jgi:hypothetical protein